MTPSISVVIGTYKRRSLLPRVLDPLLADPATDEIVVVVDGCDDGSIEYLRERATRDRILRPLLTPNQGEGATRQRGLEEATGDIVLFLDDDVVAGPGLVSGHLARHAGADHGAGLIVLGYMPTPAPETRTQDAFTTILYAREYEKRCERFEAAPDRTIYNMWGGNISLRREDALRVGMSHAAYPKLYYQDRVWGLQARRAGMHAVFDRSLRATHAHQRSATDFFLDAAKQGAGLAHIHHLFPELGPLRAEALWSGLPAPLAHLVRASSDDRIHATLLTTLSFAVDTLGRAQQWDLQMRAAALLRRIQQRWGLQRAVEAISADAEVDLQVSVRWFPKRPSSGAQEPYPGLT